MIKLKVLYENKNDVIKLMDNLEKSGYTYTLTYARQTGKYKRCYVNIAN
ncbi:MAG: hypothetical protein PHD70_13640 [Anaerostipes sp.]|nr:hypothetical protein [Anaerostipes sp.]MDD3747498.1 hypothetical protein [Anaerostipes sp.]MDD4371279.1 hypothetical protein [Anaerostipes sp.]